MNKDILDFANRLESKLRPFNDTSCDDVISDMRKFAKQFDGRWINVQDRLPNKNTKYAGPYGVSVIGFDMNEHLDAGYTPHDISFNFEKNCFQAIGHDLKASDTIWIDAPWITHWMELPDGPKRVVVELTKEK